MINTKKELKLKKNIYSRESVSNGLKVTHKPKSKSKQNPKIKRQKIENRETEEEERMETAK